MCEEKLKLFFSDNFIERINKVIKFDSLDDLKYIHSRIHQIEKLCSFLIKFLNKNSEEYGIKGINNHYISCPWAHPVVQDGPDTCMCCYLSMDIFRIEKYLENIEEANIFFKKHNNTGNIYFSLSNSAAFEEIL